MRKPGKKLMLDMLVNMVRIRMVEETLMDLFSNGEIPGFIHVCIGQEAAPVAVCRHLKDTDHMANTHRGHGHALAKGMALQPFMAELMGRSNGPCRGRSGSMHLADHDLGIMGANGIVGGGIPIANGAAFAAKYKGTDRVTVCFFGEGATDEGTFHESLNMAAVLELPIVFVCENNGWAEFTPQSVHMPVTDVMERAAAYHIPGVRVENDCLQIYENAGVAVERARKGGGPTLLEIKSNRWFGHFVGDAQKYRPQEDIDAARAEDCIAVLEAELKKRKMVSEATLKKIQEKLSDEINEAVDYARQSSVPDKSELMDSL